MTILGLRVIVKQRMVNFMENSLILEILKNSLNLSIVEAAMKEINF